MSLLVALLLQPSQYRPLAISRDRFVRLVKLEQRHPERNGHFQTR